MIHKKVLFNNEYYWLHDTGSGFYNISPLNHYDKDGNLLADFNDISYAILFNGEIKRFQQVIGHEADLIDVKE